MPIADWTVAFDLRSTVYTSHPSPGAPGGVSTNPLPINQVVTFPAGTGYYLLRADGCSLTNTVRMTKDFVPQADGAILHRRFTGGMEMNLAIQMWQDSTHIACDTLLEQMTDTLMGYLYGLLNAGDNEGRIRWVPTGGTSTAPASNGFRMLDDIRLLTYPTSSQESGGPLEVQVSIDCDLPYAQDVTQLNPSLTGSNTVTNYGNRPSYPVWQVNGPFTGFTITNTSVTPNEVFSYNGGLPGAALVTAGNYIEIDTFRNTAYLMVGAAPNGVPSTNLKPGIEIASSDFFTIPPGANTITLSTFPVIGGTGTCLLNSAWC